MSVLHPQQIMVINVLYFAVGKLKESLPLSNCIFIKNQTKEKNATRVSTYLFAKLARGG